MPRLLEPEETDRQLADLPGVVRGAPGTLVVTVQAPTFPAGIRLVDVVAVEAEAMDHHPDIDIRWRTVTFTLSTHSAGGLTQLDIELAHRVLEAARDVGAQVGEQVVPPA